MKHNYARIVFQSLVFSHPINSTIQLAYLIRNTREFARPLGAEAISKRIRLIKRNGRSFKARAVGPTVALPSGIPHRRHLSSRFLVFSPKL